MAGRRLLDAALVLGATRNVARQHFRIRGEQLDVWSKTSTLARTLGLKRVRAVDLENQKAAQATAVFTQKTAETESIPRHETVEATEPAPAQEGLNQDHHYERSQQNTAKEPVKEEGLEIKQEKPENVPLPDGTLPPKDVPAGTPKAKPVNADVAQRRFNTEHKEEIITNHASSTAKEIKPASAIPEQDSVPEGVNTDVFHSPRVAKMLGGRTFDSAAKGSKNPYDRPGNPYKREAVKQEISPVRQAQPVEPVIAHSQSTAEALQVIQPPAETTQNDKELRDLAADLASDVTLTPAANAETNQSVEASSSQSYSMRESRVPSSRIGRLWQYGGLATSMAFGAVGETFRRATGSGGSGSLMLSERNMERLVVKLSRMRGAALKLGQMMSFQDSKMLPGPIAEVLRRVQDNADYMPASQRNSVLSSNLGSDFSSLFTSFDDKPIAAASIGQVHRAVLASTGKPVAVKIQYPGVATSISSDLNNLSVLLSASGLLPKGLYLDKTIANARTELAWECDYTREAACQTRFRALLSSETSLFTVPEVHFSASGPSVLTADFMSGTGVTKPALNLTRLERDHIGTQILRLCLRELTEFRFMQTDPNWTNFLFDRSAINDEDRAAGIPGKIQLLDFGASRDFPTKFTDPYIRILIAASKGDRETIRALSVQLGYLTGFESSSMTDAHVTSVLTLSEPFSNKLGRDEAYDFEGQTVTDRVRELIPVMVRERLAPPPEETYSLHRKLSGAFLMLARLGSRVQCRRLFEDAVREWEIGLKGRREEGLKGSRERVV